jgi:hypothetical protein
MNFIVLSGTAGAGKDSIAKILVEKHAFKLVSLSHEMKVFVARAFGWSDDQVFGPSSMRNAPDPRWARPCTHCKCTGKVRSMREHPCPKCNGEGKINDNSPRRVLQLLGDEWGRQMIHPDIWTMVTRPVIEDLLKNDVKIVINDARFQNDRNNLHDWFGAVRVDVQTQKVKKDGAAWRNHGSELSRPTNDEVEYVISNDEDWPFPSLESKINAMFSDLATKSAMQVKKL